MLYHFQMRRHVINTYFSRCDWDFIFGSKANPRFCGDCIKFHLENLDCFALDSSYHHFECTWVKLVCLIFPFIMVLTLCILGNFACLFLSSANFFQNQPFRKILSGLPSGCQTVWIQIRPDILSGLIWVQTVFKGYQQTTLVSKELILNSVTDNWKRTRKPANHYNTIYM